MKKPSPVLDRMIKARAGLIMSQPFYGTLALKLEFVEDAKCKTTWTDGRRIGFNPDHIRDLPLGQVEAILAHHVMSCALGHPWRREGREKDTWNDACDYAVNADLKREGFELPEGSLLDPRFDAQYSEQVYSTLMQEKPEPQEGGDDSGDQSGSGSGDGAGSSAGSGAPGQPQDGEPGDSADGQGDSQGQGKGNDATGETRDGENEDGSTMSESQKSDAQEDWRESASQAAQLSRGHGNAPGDLDRMMSQILAPMVDWREVVQNKIRSRAKSDYNWSRPSRRSMSSGIYLPSLDNPHCGPLAFAFDMSGSITQEQLDQFCAEVEDVKQTVRPECIYVLVFDHGVREVLTFQPEEDIKIQAQAGGGTAFAPPVEVIDAMDLNPEILIYLTDLDGGDTWPEEPSYPVVWVTTGETYAPFGDVVRMI